MADEITVTDLAEAREIVRTRLYDQPAETIEIATLLTDELLANAMEHGAGTPRLALEVVGPQLLVRVDDDVSTPYLIPESIEPTRERGRGLAIVNALAAQWGVEPRRDGGKSVWFRLNLSSANGHGRPSF